MAAKDDAKQRPGKGKPLSGLAAALVKAGHLDEKKARELVREQRRDQRQEEKLLGREGVAEREAERQEELAAQRAVEAERARAREQAQREEGARERTQRAVREGLDPGHRGGRRWFFVARDGRVLYLDLQDQTAALLADGQAAIVESAGADKREHVVVAGQRPIVTLLGIDKELVRFWNRQTG